MFDMQLLDLMMFLIEFFFEHFDLFMLAILQFFVAIFFHFEKGLQLCDFAFEILSVLDNDFGFFQCGVEFVIDIFVECVLDLEGLDDLVEIVDFHLMDCACKRGGLHLMTVSCKSNYMNYHKKIKR